MPAISARGAALQVYHVHLLGHYALVHFPPDLPDSCCPDPTVGGSSQAPLPSLENKETHGQTLSLPSPSSHDSILHHWTRPTCVRIHPSHAKRSISLPQTPASLHICILGVAQYDHQLLLGHLSVSRLLC